MAFCMECGSPLQDGAKFCFQCGTPVSISINTEVSGSQNNKNCDGYVELSSEGDSALGNLRGNEKSVISVEQKPETTVWTKPNTDYPEAGSDEEDDDDFDYSQHDFDSEITSPSIEGNSPDLSGLSTAKQYNDKGPTDTPEDVSIERDPATDPFYDSIMPEIENEIYQIPKEIFIRAILIIFAILLIVIWLLFILS